MMIGFLNRLVGDTKQTMGNLVIYDKNWKEIFRCVTLELPDRQNQTSVSRIPEGAYQVNPIKSPGHGECYDVTNVLDRKYIRIHAGNYHKDTQGCILVGDRFERIDADAEFDVANSDFTLGEMRDRIQTFKLFIK